MIYIFIIGIFLLLLVCVFSQRTRIKTMVKESFENISQKEAPQVQEESEIDAKMGEQWEREIKDSTFNTNMPSQITYENILAFPDAEIKLEPRDKVYVNPFFPDDKSKGTVQLETPRQNYPDLSHISCFKDAWDHYIHSGKKESRCN